MHILQRRYAARRILDEEASLLVLTDLLVVRPFISSLALFLGMNDSNIYTTHLFVKSGSRLNNRSIRNIFAELFADYSTISFQDLRAHEEVICPVVRLSSIRCA